MQKFRCSACELEREAARKPRAWKEHNGLVMCPTCWEENYVIRAVTFPVAGPESCSWAELQPLINTAWQDSTRLSNWLMTELVKGDVIRDGQEKMPKLDHPYLYPAARKIAPNMDPQSVVSLLQSGVAKYRALRYRIIWTHQVSLPSFRYPVPYPVHNQGWRPGVLADGRPVVDIRFPGAVWHQIRLRSGKEFGRQLEVHRQLLRGEAKMGELALIRRRISEGDHRSGAKKGFRLFCKLVAWVPRRKKSIGSAGIMIVNTVPDSFWTAEVEGRDPWRLHADHVRQWVSEGDRRRRRLSDDLKYEKRWPRRTRERMVAAGRKRADRLNRRLDAWTHQASHMLTEFARRQMVRRVVYDDREQGYLEHFPWAQLRERLKYKLGGYSIEFEYVGDAEGEKKIEGILEPMKNQGA